jgi:hypothetical protein
MAVGFVYLLGNPAMPCYYKIGCTERAPHARAAELSRSSGVPHPFHVLLYIEVDEFQAVEQRFHKEIADFRPRFDREFFMFSPAHMPWVYWAFKNHPGALAFTVCQWHRYCESDVSEYIETWVFDGEELCLPSVAPIVPGDLKLVAA